MRRMFEKQSLIGYHGTTDKGFQTYAYTYYSGQYSYAKEYAGETGRVRKVSIDIQNPFILEARYMGQGEIILDNRIIGFYRDLDTNIVEILGNRGYDGIVVNYDGIEAFEIIPFSDSQVTELDRDVQED